VFELVDSETSIHSGLGPDVHEPETTVRDVAKKCLL
jgi:hypothetical protein